MKTKREIFEPVFKDLTHDKLIELFDHTHPISLKDHQEIIERVSQKYPYLPKTEIALIFKAMLNVWRDQYLIGNNLALPGLIRGLQMMLSPVIRTRHYLPDQIPRLYCWLRTRIYQLPDKFLRELKEKWKK